MSTKLERLLSEYSWAVEYLTHDADGEDTGHLQVPCSRYGWNGAECAPVAVAAAITLARAQGEDIGESADTGDTDTLEYVMGLVVNDHDDVTYLLREHGPSELDISWRTLRDQLLA